MKTRTTKQLERIWKRIWKRIEKGMGYQPYGYDWPTLHACRPLMYSALKITMQRLKVPVVERG